MDGPPETGVSDANWPACGLCGLNNLSDLSICSTWWRVQYACVMFELDYNERGRERENERARECGRASA